MNILNQQSIVVDINFLTYIRLNALTTASTPIWSEIIHDFVHGLGYSYSRIARRIDLAPATIQQLANYSDRVPKTRVLFKLLRIYYKVFYAFGARPEAIHYIQNKKNNSLAWVKDLHFDTLNAPRKLQLLRMQGANTKNQ